jgi:hypothetical protein
MDERAIVRVWQEVSVKDVSPHLLIAGELSADCWNCKEVGIAFETKNCPTCGTLFKYMGTRLTGTVREAKRLRAKRPDLILIDLKDFKEGEARKRAHGFLGD